jgi:hypothetical protein
MNVFKINSRTAVGTGLAIGILLVVGAAIGKSTGSGLPWLEGLLLPVGAIPGGLVGSLLGQKLKIKSLRFFMALTIIAITVKIWADLLQSFGVFS